MLKPIDVSFKDNKLQRALKDRPVNYSCECKGFEQYPEADYFYIPISFASLLDGMVLISRLW